MSCSRLIGSIILSFFLFTSLVANNIVPKDVKIEENTEATAGEGTFSNDGEGSILGTSPKIDGSGTNLGQNRPEKTGAYNKDAATNPMSAVNTDKNPSDVISGKDASEVFNKGEQSRVDLVPQENGITNGAVKSKTGEILRKEGDVIKAPASELNSLGIDGGILKAKEGEILRKEGDVIKASNSNSDRSASDSNSLGIDGGVLKVKEGAIFNKDYNRHSAFKINDRTEAVIQNDTRVDCPEGYVADCSGDGDCCSVYWIGDGYGDCEDQAFGCDLTCYGNDGGDCDVNTTTTTTSGGGANLIATYNMTYDWYCSGSYGTAVVNFYDDYSADLDGVYPGTWGFTTATTMDDGLCSAGSLGDGYYFQFDNYATRYTWDQTGCGYHDDLSYNGEGNVDGVTVLYDFIDPAACYGDGGTTTTTTTTTSGGCADGYVDDCSGDGDCCPESWIGDGFADCEDQAYGCDLTCYGDDGGDCAGGTTTTTTGGGGNLMWSTTATYDWYCTGSYGSASINFYDDGTADFEGYPGFWFYPDDAGYDMPDGLCAGGMQYPDLTFVFANYQTAYAWDTEGDDMYTPGCGVHDDFGYNGQNVDGTTSINGADPASCYGDGGTTTTTTTTTSGAGCPDGYVEDCVDADCCPESWIGDGFEDCEDQAYGCDLTCYDNDGGDCGDGTTTTTTTTTSGGCADGYVDDCSGDGDCCPESWIGDGLGDCEDQAWGCDLTCYDNDAGDCDEAACGDGVACWDGTCAATYEECFDLAGGTLFTQQITYDWGCSGAPGDAQVRILNSVWEGTTFGVGFVTPDNLWVGVWNDWYSSPVETPGDGYGCPDWSGNQDWGFFFADFQNVGYLYDCGGDENNSECQGYHSADGYETVMGWTTSYRLNPDECPEGTVDDCAGDGDCCPESWIGDGFEDCEDQAYGCDLTCYDNDGGDCDGGTTGGTTTGGECPDGYIPDCVDDDCCPESWIGDGFEDCEDQAYGCDLTCYDNDGGDCDGGGTTTTGGGDCDEIIWSTTMTYDWYCTGSPGYANFNLCANGVADLEGYTGTWTSGNGEVYAEPGLCDLAGSIDSDLTFAFDNYATLYTWDTEGDDIYTPGSGFHDDQAYNGEGNVDGLTCVNGADCTGGGYTTTTTTTTSGGECADGYVEDCSGDGDCCPFSWIGDGFEDCEDQAYGCDLTCYANDGGDCEGDPEDDTYNEADIMENGGVFNFTYDWYCTGSPGTAQVVLFWDGESECNGFNPCPASIEGYDGYWGVNSEGGSIPFDDGLCPGTILDWDFGFGFANYATQYSYDLEEGDAGLFGGGVHDDLYYNGQFNVDGTSAIESEAGGTTTTTTTSGGCPDGYVDDCSGDGDCCPESWIGDGFEDCEDQAYGCDLTCYDNDGGDCGTGCEPGDVNCDGSIDVVDVVNMVNAIINGNDLEGGDINGDGSLDVVDVVLLVNYIIDGGARAMDADSATMTIADNSLRLSADGYIGGVQMTLSHGNGFELDLTNNAMVSEYKTTGTSTMLVVVVPEEDLIFTANQSFEVVDMIVANSEGEIEVNTVSEFGLTAAYPNPFNPSTTVSLNVPSADFVSVKVYNLVGQVVGVLAEGMMDANTYTFTWNATDMSSGVYMIRAESGSNVDIQKVLLVK